VLATIPVDSVGNEPHGVNTMARADGVVVATGLRSDRVFVFDLRDPLRGKLRRVVEPSASRVLRAPVAVVTERAGRLRIIKGGVLDPKPIAGVPTARNRTDSANAIPPPRRP